MYLELQPQDNDEWRPAPTTRHKPTIMTMTTTTTTTTMTAAAATTKIPTLQPPSTAQAASWLVVLTVVSSAYEYPLHTHLTAALAWALIFSATHAFSSTTAINTTITTTITTITTTPAIPRNGDGCGWKWKPPAVAACIFVAETCRATAGAGGGGGAVLVPVLLAVARGREGWRVVAAAAVVGVAGTCAVGEVWWAPCLWAAAAAAVLLQLERTDDRLGLARDAAACLVPAFLAASVLAEDLLGEVSARHGSGWHDVVMRNAGGRGAVAFRVAAIAAVDAVRWALVSLLAARTTATGAAGVQLVPTLAGALWAQWSLVGAVASAVATAAMLVVVGGQVGRAHVLVLACCAGGLAVAMLLSGGGGGGGAAEMGARPERITSASGHPIPALIAAADERYYAMRSRQSSTLAQAVDEYKRRYRMPPPPHFDRWYAFARARNVVLIDEYDTIYHSLKPFWGLPPHEIRRRARRAMGYDDPVGMANNRLLHAYVRGGRVEIGGQGPEWQKAATRDMLAPFARWLPDMDLPFNIHDEPRVMVPFDALQALLDAADAEIAKLSLAKGGCTNAFTPLGRAEKSIPPSHREGTPFAGLAHSSVFAHSTLSCPPDSPVHQPAATAPDRAEDDRPPGRLLGFIANATLSSDICLSPSLEHRHGFFDRPNTFNVVKALYPVFSQSKVSSYGDIVYPSPWYWARRVAYDEHRDPPWDRKLQKLYWRGSTTGGFSRNGGWKRHHRQRVVSAIDAADAAKILQRPPPAASNSSSSSSDTAWSVTTVPRESLRELFDVRFSHVGQCTPPDCAAQRRFFRLAPVAAQHSAWAWKYLLDMDGNAFSGRFHAFLHSRSAVFKLAVFREWHDEWLLPWVHYVPLSLQLDEVAETVRFFRFEPDGEALARRIAHESRAWARRTLRREDLEAWMFRLLLEYARVTDGKRDSVGFGG